MARFCRVLNLWYFICAYLLSGALVNDLKDVILWGLAATVLAVEHAQVLGQQLQGLDLIVHLDLRAILPLLDGGNGLALFIRQLRGGGDADNTILESA